MKLLAASLSLLALTVSLYYGYELGTKIMEGATYKEGAIIKSEPVVRPFDK